MGICVLVTVISESFGKEHLIQRVSGIMGTTLTGSIGNLISFGRFSNSTWTVSKIGGTNVPSQNCIEVLSKLTDFRYSDEFLLSSRSLSPQHHS